MGSRLARALRALVTPTRYVMRGGGMEPIEYERPEDAESALLWGALVAKGEWVEAVAIRPDGETILARTRAVVTEP